MVCYQVGKSVKGVFQMANLTPMMWYSKKQATAETATYGAEFLAARTCVEQKVDLRNAFRYLGVPVFENSLTSKDFGFPKSLTFRIGLLRFS